MRCSKNKLDSMPSLVVPASGFYSPALPIHAAARPRSHQGPARGPSRQASVLLGWGELIRQDQQPPTDPTDRRLKEGWNSRITSQASGGHSAGPRPSLGWAATAAIISLGT